MPDKNSGWSEEHSPFHSGEHQAQERAGVREQMEAFGRKVIRTFMPDQHRAFFEKLPFIAVGHVDGEGWPWATMLIGTEGFLRSPDPETLRIEARPHPDDPLTKGMHVGSPIGVLGLDFATRRRNRLNARIQNIEASGFEVSVDQSFGNCPQYIQTRAFDFIRDPAEKPRGRGEPLSNLDEAATSLIERADTFFVSSYVTDKGNPRVEGVDISHRGGKPGFVKVAGRKLTIPDFSGNFHFNTLGNFLINPRAGLVFVDFETGDVLMLTGTVQINWDSPEAKAFRGAERTWSFVLDHGLRLNDALPLRWTFDEFSPNSLDKGSWDEAGATLATQKEREAWRPYRVVRTKDESDVIRSFYLAPDDGNPNFSFEAGQYLTVKVFPPGVRKPVIRTYTLSSEPGAHLYRISIKREMGSPGGRPAGVMSTYWHDCIKPGDIVEAKAPRGDFFIDTTVDRPAVLLAGGVGITPMISIARHVAYEGSCGGKIRPLTLIHSTQDTRQRAFFDEARSLTNANDGIIRYISLIDTPSQDDRTGITYDGVGYITAEVLKKHLPLDDYDFFLCGPPPFMQGLYDTLRGLGARDLRIFAESFGPATLRRRPDENTPVDLDGGDLGQEAQAALVRFDRSKFDQRWTRKDGTLLELAEDHGLSPDYGCRSGACGSCSVKILGGSVAYRTRPSTTPPEGEALICCAVPADSDDNLILDI